MLHRPERATVATTHHAPGSEKFHHHDGQRAGAGQRAERKRQTNFCRHISQRQARTLSREAVGRLSGSAMTRDTTALAASGAALLGLAAFALARWRADQTLTIPAHRPPPVATIDPGAAVRAAQRMNRAAGV